MRLLQFENLSSEVRSVARFRNLETDERLYHQGDRAESVHCVVSGFLSLQNHTSEGKTVLLYVIGPGEYVSEAALFAENYCSDVIAETPCRVSMYPKQVVTAALERDPVLAREFMALQSRRFNLLRARLELHSIRSARARVMKYFEIAKLPGSCEGQIDRPLKSIAQDIGLTHETLYRTLAKLRSEGVIPRNVPKTQRLGC